MKHSDSNHLRRLLAWVSCEIGQTPEELVATVQNIAGKLGPVDIADAGRQRMVEAHDKARAVPAYVHAALKALRKATDTMGEVVEPVPADLHAAIMNLPRLSTPEGLNFDQQRAYRMGYKDARNDAAELAAAAEVGRAMP